MPPVQNMTDNCDLPHGDSQFAQNLTCLRDSEKTRHHLDDAAHQDSDAPPASNIALESTTMNGDVHLDELADSVQQPDKKPTADEPSGPCDEGPEDDSPVTNENSNNIPSTAECEGSLDDFADFEGYSDLNLSNSPQVNNSEDHTVDCSASNLESKNFANFEGHSHWPTLAADTQAQPPADDDAFDDDDDFADFESASNETQPHAPSATSAIQSTQNANASTDWAQLFQKTFPQDVQLPEESADSSGNVSSLALSSSQIFNYASPESQALWDSLQDMDLKSICLLNKWKNSHSFKRILQALKVDGNIIKMNTDIFHPYSHISHYGQILEPTSINSWGQSLYENNVSTNNSVDFTAKAKANETAITSPDEEFQSVISLNQDLDFFESKYSYKNSSISSNTKPSNDLISEFENIILDNGKAQFNQEESKQAALSATSPASSVNDLRKMLQNTIAKTNNEQVLSAEALHILNELPRLNFARANVLMWNVNEHSAPNG